MHATDASTCVRVGTPGQVEMRYAAGERRGWIPDPDVPGRE